MAATKKANAKRAPKKAAPKKAAKRTTPKPAPENEPEPSSGPDSTALGEALTKHADALPKPAAAAAATLAAGETPAHGALVELRDGINSAAAALRGNGKKDVARELSQHNRLVRRLERAARK